MRGGTNNLCSGDHDESLIEFATRVIRIDSGKIISDEIVDEADSCLDY